MTSLLRHLNHYLPTHLSDYIPTDHGNRKQLRSSNVQTDDGAIYRRNRRYLLHIADTQVMNMISESATAPTPNVNQQDRTAADDVCSSNTPIITSARIVKKSERCIETC